MKNQVKVEKLRKKLFSGIPLQNSVKFVEGILNKNDETLYII